MAGIGVKKPYYAKYVNTAGIISYTGGAIFAKAVEFSAKIEGGKSNNLYADDAIVETDSGFGGGTISVTTDDLSQAVSAVIMGITATSLTVGAETVSELIYDDDAAAPDLGFGIIIPKKVSGVVKYRAIVFTKIKFSIPAEAAKTQGETIEWQTPVIEGTIMRDDSAKHAWKREATVDSEAEAEAYIKNILDIA
jgi:phi13 family phage major tail protein